MDRSVGVGVGVGLSDLALVYPLAVLACRREAGVPLRDAIRAGRLWSGAATQVSLIPYSIMVEAGTKWVRREVDAPPVVAALVISGLVSVGLQPLEKKLVVDQLLQSKPAAPAQGGAALRGGLGQLLEPARAIAQYGRENGARSLYKGFVPLAMREFIYIAALSVVNPHVVSAVEQHFGDSGGPTVAPEALGAFAVGFSAGMISAPCQTVNAMMKDERNKNKSLGTVVREDVFGRGGAAGVRRLFFGAATRSARCGGAGVLYFAWRTILGATRDVEPAAGQA